MIQQSRSSYKLLNTNSYSSVYISRCNTLIREVFVVVLILLILSSPVITASSSERSVYVDERGQVLSPNVVSLVLNLSKASLALPSVESYRGFASKFYSKDSCRYILSMEAFDPDAVFIAINLTRTEVYDMETGKVYGLWFVQAFDPVSGALVKIFLNGSYPVVYRSRLSSDYSGFARILYVKVDGEAFAKGSIIAVKWWYRWDSQWIVEGEKYYIPGRCPTCTINWASISCPLPQDSINTLLMKVPIVQVTTATTSLNALAPATITTTVTETMSIVTTVTQLLTPHSIVIPRNVTTTVIVTKTLVKESTVTVTSTATSIKEDTFTIINGCTGYTSTVTVTHVKEVPTTITSIVKSADIITVVVVGLLLMILGLVLGIAIRRAGWYR